MILNVSQPNWNVGYAVILDYLTVADRVNKKVVDWYKIKTWGDYEIILKTCGNYLYFQYF